ncbi:hypothetical protein B7G54_29435 [Burkholderia puraquae]|uniref:Uncharacterized protein n=1 Tax=Burkholderia puraquae TaxID=1904757 RepID=A0A1X1P9X0_9BURK|nr:hypothetical protein B7G54_29435 [Burkholderia puraquae]CAB3767523.1 hypothetical protein LMG29660_05842 [Burkholderia puraquae]
MLIGRPSFRNVAASTVSFQPWMKPPASIRVFRSIHRRFFASTPSADACIASAARFTSTSCCVCHAQTQKSPLEAGF